MDFYGTVGTGLFVMYVETLLRIIQDISKKEHEVVIRGYSCGSTWEVPFTKECVKVEDGKLIFGMEWN